MAYDKLVDSSQLNSDLGDVADAIRAKSGGSSQLAFPSGFISEIGNISTGGGGGSLPSIISKIDGGSFTPANDIASNSYPISHTLGTTPTGIAIWSENIVAESYGVRTLDKLISIDSVYVETQINTNGNKGNANGTLTDVGTDSFTISIAALNYKAGAQYKWLAWA